MAHIIERNEKLDYRAFYHAPGKGFPHGRVTTKAAGNATWELWEGLADNYPCPPCKPAAQAIAHGGHDMVNLLLGKRAKTPQHFERLHDLLEEAWGIYQGKNRHPRTEKHIVV